MEDDVRHGLPFDRLPPLSKALVSVLDDDPQDSVRTEILDSRFVQFLTLKQRPTAFTCIDGERS